MSCRTFLQHEGGERGEAEHQVEAIDAPSCCVRDYERSARLQDLLGKKRVLKYVQEQAKRKKVAI